MPTKKEGRRIIERARDTYESAAEKMNDAKDKTKETIKEHPFTSVIIAAAIGAIAGVATAELIRKVRKEERKSVIDRIKDVF